MTGTKKKFRKQNREQACDGGRACDAVGGLGDGSAVMLHQVLISSPAAAAALFGLSCTRCCSKLQSLIRDIK